MIIRKTISFFYVNGFWGGLSKIRFFASQLGLKGFIKAVLKKNKKSSSDNSDMKALFKEQQSELTPDIVTTEIREFKHKPLFSVVMPIYNPDIKWLKVAIESLQKQYYTGWELCVVDDGSPVKDGIACVKSYGANDSRIRLHVSECNGGISVASNIAAKLAKGEYIVLLDQDDEITPDSFFWLAKYINENPTADYIYSDECKIDENGNLSSFLLKPDELTPCLMINNMFAGHLVAYSRELFLKSGGFDSHYDFGQDYEMAMRMLNYAKNIVHVPRILYLWRTLPTSTASGGKAFTNYLNMSIPKSFLEAHGIKTNIYKKYDYNRPVILGASPLVSIIFCLRDETASLDALIRIFDITSYRNYEVVVVGSYELCGIAKHRLPYISGIRYVVTDVVSYTDNIRLGLTEAKGENVIILHSYCFPATCDWIDHLVGGLSLPNIGAVSPMVIDEDDCVLYASGSSECSNDYMLHGTPFQRIKSSENDELYLLSIHVSKECRFLSKYCIAYNRERINVDIYEYCSEFTVADAVSYQVINHGNIHNLYMAAAVVKCKAVHNQMVHGAAKYTEAMLNFTNLYQPDSFFTALMKRQTNISNSNITVRVFNDGVKTYSYEKKKILVLTHELSLTGAPIVVLDAVKEMLAAGYNVVVASPFDGPLRKEYKDLGVILIVDERLAWARFSAEKKSKFKLDWYFDYFVEEFDLIFLCTFVNHALVSRWAERNIPMFWWLHEGEYTHEFAKGIIFKKVPDNVYVYSGGIYAQEMLHRYGYEYDDKVLLYGTYDVADFDSKTSQRKDLRFIIVGSIDERKAQDLVFKAIKNIESYLHGVEFIFVGGQSFGNTYKKLVEDVKGYSNIELLPPVSRQELMGLYQSADCLICPSRDDPMPVVVTEMMMLSKAVICSTNVGQSRYITHGVDGYVFENNNADALSDIIKHIIINRHELSDIGRNGRKIYEKEFSMDVFRDNLLKELENIFRRCKRG